MRRWIKIILICLLLAGGALVCIVRWQAWFGMPAEPQWNDQKSDYRFPVFVSDSTPEALTLVVLGDIHNRLNSADYDSLAARVPQADAILQVGDWMDRGQDYYYQLLVREWTQSALSGTPVIACPGNHEYTKGLPKELSEPWSKAFTVPNNGPVGVPGVSYYMDLPQLRLIAIDTNPMDRLVYMTRTLTWLRAAMKEADGRYIVVMMHHPILSVAKGRFNSTIYATFRHALDDADLVLAGHDHSYMRAGHFVVINTAGVQKTQRKHLHADAMADEPVYGVLTIDKGMTFEVRRMSDAQVIDSIHVQHE